MGAMAEIYPLQLLIASLAGLMNRRDLCKNPAVS
jgi:hypothetical protein